MNKKLDQKFQKEWIRLFQAWLLFLPNFLSDYYETQIRPSLFISEKTLRESKYLKHFPHQIFSIGNHRQKSRQYITPASCLHVYPKLKNKKVENFSTLIIAHCGRFESGSWKPPYRLPDFHMAELVVIGTGKTVNSKKEVVRKLIDKTFAGFGLRGNFQNATDTFFLNQDKGAKIVQQLKGLKQEYIVNDGAQSVALASVNSHEDFFGKCFNIKTGNSFAHSFCAAFGVERLAAFSLNMWSKDQRNWPKKFKKYAKIS